MKKTPFSTNSIVWRVVAMNSLLVFFLLRQVIVILDVFSSEFKSTILFFVQLHSSGGKKFSEMSVLGPVNMEASYQVDRVTRFAGTNKRSVYMEPSYSALVCSIHCSYMK